MNMFNFDFRKYRDVRQPSSGAQKVVSTRPGRYGDIYRYRRYGDIYRYRRYACMAVRFLDVNGIFEKRIIRTFGKCTRQLNRSV